MNRMTILEYIRLEPQDVLAIPTKAHPVVGNYGAADFSSDLEAVAWFNQSFPINHAREIYKLLDLHIDNPDNQELLLQFNAFSVHKSGNEVFMYNNLWNSSPTVTVTCRCCGLAESEPLARANLFKNNKNLVLGVENICKRCAALSAQFHTDNAKVKIRGPYSMLKDSKVCTVCSKGFSLEQIPFNFRRVRWSASSSAFESLAPSSYSDKCLACEALPEHKPKRIHKPKL